MRNDVKRCQIVFSCILLNPSFYIVLLITDSEKLVVSQLVVSQWLVYPLRWRRLLGEFNPGLSENLLVKAI